MALEEVLGRAIVELRAPSDKLKKDLDEATGHAKQSIDGTMGAAGDASDKVSGRLGGAAKAAAALGGTLASAGIARVLMGAADAASDLGEAQNANNVVFKDGAGEIDTFAQGAIKNLGLAEITVRNLATGFGGMFSAVGWESKEAATATTELITRARDVGSVFNESADVVANAFGSALRGEAEPARRFGVFLNAASIEAEALSLGLGKTTVDLTKVKGAQIDAEKAQAAFNKAVKEHGKNSIEARDAMVGVEEAHAKVAKAMEGGKTELTDADKMQAAYSLTMKQTAAMAGDYKNTMDSKANSDQRAKEAAKEASATLGESLAPILAKVSDLAGKAAQGFSKLPGPAQTAVAALLGFAVLAGPIGSVVTLLGALGIVGPAAGVGAGAAGAGATAASGGFRAMAASAWAAMVPLLPWIALAAAVGIAGYLLYRNWDTVTKGIGAALNWLGERWDIVVGVILGVIAGPFGTAIGLIVSKWDWVKNTGSAMLNWLQDRWNQFTNFITNIPNRIGGALGGIWNGLADGFRRAWNAVAGLINRTPQFTLPGIFGGGTVGIPRMPYLFTGGDIAESGLARVGERGPETVWLPRGAKVEPHTRGARPGGGGGITQIFKIAGSVITERQVQRLGRQGLSDTRRRNGSTGIGG